MDVSYAPEKVVNRAHHAHSGAHPRLNENALVMARVSGQIAHPVMRGNPYRIGHDGIARVLPSTGGIALNQRIGDPCIGLAGDHIEPGVALHNNSREVVGPRDGPNTALLTLSCIGNLAEVIDGPCAGQRGIVTGKHGGVNHVLIDFPTPVLARLRIGDRIQIRAHGAGVALLDYPDIEVMNCAPALLRAWGLYERERQLLVPITHTIPAALMGSGLGKNTAWRGDYDIQLADRRLRDRYRLGSLRFGDMVAIVNADTRRGPLFNTGKITIGIIVHGDSTVSGHGPGVTPLLTGPARQLIPLRRAQANLAALLGVRRLPTAQNFRALTDR